MQNLFSCPNRRELYDRRLYMKYSMPLISVLAQFDRPFQIQTHDDGTMLQFLDFHNFSFHPFFQILVRNFGLTFEHETRH